MSDQWMQCTTCKAIVQLNNTGICLACQGGFNSTEIKDKYELNDIDKLKEREKELENALQKPSTEKVHVQPTPKASKGVRGSNSKRKKAPQETKKEG